jgi:hypothetical protein
VQWKPVYGDVSGEPCYDTANNAPGYCAQEGYRFNLDQEQDTSGNVIAYFYSVEGNRYARNGVASRSTTYVRSARLIQAQWGATTGSPGPTARLIVSSVPRCLAAVADATQACSAMTAANSGDYPDVPTDLICAQTCDAATQKWPTFYSGYRVSQVVSQRLVGGAWQKVDQVDIQHAFPDPDGTGPEQPELWLHHVTRSGIDNAGNKTSLPVVGFGGFRSANRVDYNTAGGVPQLLKYRLFEISNELGGKVYVTYGHNPLSVGGDNGCTQSTVSSGSYPANTNGRECFPRYFKNGGNPGWGWFHKYVVLQVSTNSPKTGSDIRNPGTTAPLSESVVTDYRYNAGYSGGAGWHHDEDPIAPDATQSWSDWRGYEFVKEISRPVVNNVVGTSALAVTDHRFFRGMNGDKAGPSGGTKAVNITTIEKGPETDNWWQKGQEAETTVLAPAAGQNGTSTTFPALKRTWTHYAGWQSVPGTRPAVVTAPDQVKTRTAANGSATGLKNTVNYTYNFNTTTPRAISNGTLALTEDLGDETTTGDETCATTNYLYNATAWLLTTAKSRSYANTCADITGTAAK